MPEGSQLLYFHLILRADDDGVAEAYPIMKLLGTAPDNFKVLLAKGLIKQLNEDQVVVITDWLEHNSIRPDRKVDSMYKELLIENDIPTVKAKPRSDVADNSRRVGGPSTDSIGKVRLGKDSIDKVSNTQGENTPVKVDKRNPNVQEIWEHGINLGFTNKKEHLNRYAIARLLKDVPKDRLKQIIEYARKIQDQQYAPRIYNFLDLEEKLPKLKDFADRQKAKQPKTIDLTNL